MLRHHEEPRFDDAAQRQIIALAAELQRAEREGATLAELEAKARQSGIDPRYVRMALGQTAPSTTEVTEGPWYRDRELTLVTVGGFLFAQIFSIYGLLGSGPTVALPIAFFLSIAVGAVMSRTPGQRWGAVASVVGSTVGVGFAIHMLMRLGLIAPYYYHRYSRWDEMLLFAGAQIVAVVIGILCAAVARGFRRVR